MLTVLKQVMNSLSLPKGDKVHALRKNSKLLFSLEELLVLVMQCYPVLPKEKYTCAFNSPLGRNDYRATLKEKNNKTLKYDNNENPY